MSDCVRDAEEYFDRTVDAEKVVLAIAGLLEPLLVPSYLFATL